MNANSSWPRVYLAGPEVFLPNAIEVGAAKTQLCAKHQIAGLFPLDQSIDLSGLSAKQQAQEIARANETLMRSCDAVIANLTPFRGVSMDSGTAFEVGFMRALGKPVFGYTASGDDYRARCERFRACTPGWRDGDRPAYDIEDFGLAENLMIDVAVSETGAPVARGHAAEVDIADLAAFERCATAAAPLIKQFQRSRT
jgi:nucleoside 2-deoxyribosyltransferase